MSETEALNKHVESAVRTAVYPDLAGKRVVITGGGSGIGEAIVEGFVAQGARVVFLDIAAKDSEALVARLTPTAATPPTFRRTDLTDLDDLAAAMTEADEALGGIDILVNNAANDDRHKIEDVTPEYWDNRLAVNLRHLFFAAKAVVPGMKARGRGAIINLGSISWHLGLPDLVLYQTAKAGIEGMTRALARDLGPHNIRVNAVIPGAIKTPRQDALWHDEEETRRIMEAQCLPGRVMPADVAAMIVFLATENARYCTAHTYFVDGGWR